MGKVHIVRINLNIIKLNGLFIYLGILSVLECKGQQFSVLVIRQ